MAAITVCSDFGAPQNKVSHCIHCFPICLPWSDGTGCHDLSFLNVFKLAFSLSSFIFIKRLFSSSSLSAIRVVSSVYLRLLIFLLQSWFQLMLHPPPGFFMMYSAYKLNKQDDNIQPSCTPFPIWRPFPIWICYVYCTICTYICIYTVCTYTGYIYKIDN